MVFCKKTNTLQGIFFVTLTQQKLVETASFNELFLHYGKSGNDLVTLTPK